MHSMRLIGRVNTDDRRVSPASSSNLQIQKSLSELLSLLLLPKDWCYLWLQAVMVVQSYVDELTIAVNIGIIIDDRSIWVIITLTGIAYPGIWTLCCTRLSYIGSLYLASSTTIFNVIPVVHRCVPLHLRSVWWFLRSTTVCHPKMFRGSGRRNTNL